MCCSVQHNALLPNTTCLGCSSDISSSHFTNSRREIADINVFVEFTSRDSHAKRDMNGNHRCSIDASLHGNLVDMTPAISKPWIPTASRVPTPTLPFLDEWADCYDMRFEPRRKETCPDDIALKRACYFSECSVFWLICGI